MKKKVYSEPEFELVRVNISSDVLNVSDPMETTPQGSGSGADAGLDPWGDLPNP